MIKKFGIARLHKLCNYSNFAFTHVYESIKSLNCKEVKEEKKDKVKASLYYCHSLTVNVGS